MAKNRYLPYGYKVENGATAVHDEEAEIIRRIYRQYANGLSYKSIARELTAEDTRYMPDKPEWNKNMVARILQNQQYLGSGRYPAIIDVALRSSAEQVRKPYTHTEPREVKSLKPLMVCAVCGHPVRRRLKANGSERWFCEGDPNHIALSVTDSILLESIAALQTTLAEYPQTADTDYQRGKQVSIETIRLQNEIDQMLQFEESDEDSIKTKIMELAAKQYALIDGADENQLEGKEKPTGTSLNMTLLTQAVSAIRIGQTKATALILKDGTIIEERSVQA
jgi:hypothetical protein